MSDTLKFDYVGQVRKWRTPEGKLYCIMCGEHKQRRIFDTGEPFWSKKQKTWKVLESDGSISAIVMPPPEFWPPGSTIPADYIDDSDSEPTPTPEPAPSEPEPAPATEETKIETAELVAPPSGAEKQYLCPEGKFWDSVHPVAEQAIIHMRVVQPPHELNFGTMRKLYEDSIDDTTPCGKARIKYEEDPDTELLDKNGNRYYRWRTGMYEPLYDAVWDIMLIFYSAHYKESSSFGLPALERVRTNILSGNEIGPNALVKLLKSFDLIAFKRGNQIITRIKPKWASPVLSFSFSWLRNLISEDIPLEKWFDLYACIYEKMDFKTIGVSGYQSMQDVSHSWLKWKGIKQLGKLAYEGVKKSFPDQTRFSWSKDFFEKINDDLDSGSTATEDMVNNFLKPAAAIHIKDPDFDEKVKKELYKLFLAFYVLETKKFPGKFNQLKRMVRVDYDKGDPDETFIDILEYLDFTPKFYTPWHLVGKKYLYLGTLNVISDKWLELYEQSKS